MTANEFQNGWPTSRSTNRWLHSDINNVGYSFAWELFEKLIALGELDK
jgi:hypothetical protein